ncbi:MAG: class I SAM-dependent methyltransferase, partial [Planctomycetota bacterium]
MSLQSNARGIAVGLVFVALFSGCGKAPDAPSVEGRPAEVPAAAGETKEPGAVAAPAPEAPRPEDAAKPVAKPTDDADVAKETRAVVEEAGVTGGLVVHLGCGDGRETAKLFAGGSALIQGLDTDEANVMKARAHLRSEGLYGRITAARFDGRTLPYRDNLVTMIVAASPGGV